MTCPDAFTQPMTVAQGAVFIVSALLMMGLGYLIGRESNK